MDDKGVIPESPAGTVAWLAGLLEGEACFGRTHGGTSPILYPSIQVGMTDRDVIHRVARLWSNQTIHLNCYRKGSYKPMYRAQQSGIPALVTMLDVFPWMGERRRKRIEALLSTWEHTFPQRPGRPRKVCNA